MGGEGKILIVDDDGSTRSAYRDLFIGYGFETEVAENDQQALELLSRKQFQAVMLDLRITIDLLFSIAEQIKKKHPTICLSLAVVDLTPAMMKKVMDIGIDDCLVKPLLPMQLIANIKKAVTRYRLEAENQTLTKKVEEIEEEKRRWFIHDPQTGLYNSHYFNERLDVEIKRAKRHEHWLSVLVCDLMQTEAETEEIEPPSPGLEEQVRLGKFLAENLRDVDIIARYKNGFGIILPETTVEGSSSLRGRLKKHIEELLEKNIEVFFPEADQKACIRFGTATYPFDSHLPKRLVKIAEDRLQ